MKNLTEKQRQVLLYLREVRSGGQPSPTISELSEYFGYRSTRSIRDHLRALQRKGYILREPGKARAIRVLNDFGINEPDIGVIPLLGSISAGLRIVGKRSVAVLSERISIL